MPARARHGSYLFQRPRSPNWYVKLRSAGERREICLRTSDKAQAEIIALPMIAEHKARLLAARPRFEMQWLPVFAPGLHTSPDGSKVYATARELHYFDETPIRITPQRRP